MKQVIGVIFTIILALAFARSEAAVTELWMQEFIKSCVPATGVVHSNPFWSTGGNESFDFTGGMLISGDMGQMYSIQVLINGQVVWDNLGVGAVGGRLSYPGQFMSLTERFGFTTYHQYTVAGNNTLSVSVTGNVLVCDRHMKVQRYSW